jgi:hypothetical protein
VPAWGAGLLRLALLVPGQDIFGAFPGAEEVEGAKVLGELHRLVDHTLLLFGIAAFDIAGEREILAERVPAKAVIGEDAAQIVIAVEQHAEHVEHFALEPAGDREQARDRRHRLFLIGGDTDADTVVPGDRQQVIDDLEPLRRSG